MSNKTSYERGYSITWALLLLLVLAVIGFVGWKVFNKPPKSTTSSGETVSFTSWNFDGENWKASGDAPNCEEPLEIGAPMDMSRATSKLYPGQVRGTDFKPHGGLADDDAPSTDLELYAVRDAWLFQGSRYIENGVVQYLLDFMDSCGVWYRYDHIATVSDKLTQYADRLPEPKQDDSRTSRIDPVFVEKGTLVATQVGKEGNVGFDLGVYDLRKQNEASKTGIYKTDQRRISDKEQSFYSVCWFDLLPTDAKAIVNGLPSRSGAEGTSSDYCKIN